jgi:hypothetical protein
MNEGEDACTYNNEYIYMCANSAGVERLGLWLFLSFFFAFGYRHVHMNTCKHWTCVKGILRFLFLSDVIRLLNHNPK